jgi:hypothetical protein
VTFRVKGREPYGGAALPVFTVHTEAEADALIVWLCKWDRYSDRYYLPQFAGTVEALPDVTNQFAAAYAKQKEIERCQNSL